MLKWLNLKTIFSVSAKTKALVFTFYNQKKQLTLWSNRKGIAIFAIFDKKYQVSSFRYQESLSLVK